MGQGDVLVIDLHVVDRGYIVDVVVRTCPVARCVGVVHWRLDVQVVSFQDVRRTGSSLDGQDNRDDPYQVVDVLLSMVDVIQEIQAHVRPALVHEIVVMGFFVYLSCYFRPIFDLVSRPVSPGR